MANNTFFVSSSSKDVFWVSMLVAGLRNEGFDVWYDLNSLKGDTSYINLTVQEIRNRDFFLIILSPDALSSIWVQYELNFALRMNKIIIPIIHKPTQVQGFLQLRQMINATHLSTPEVVQQITTSLRQLNYNELQVNPSITSPDSQLQFTAFHPKEVFVQKNYTLLVYAHLDTVLLEIRQNAQQFSSEISAEPRESSVYAQNRIPEGTLLTFIPTFEGVTFNPPEMTLIWEQPWQRANFSFRAKKELAGYAGNGEIAIFAGPFIVAKMRISMLFTDDSGSHEETEEKNPNTSEIRGYPYNKLFVSYSHMDTDIVLEIREMYKALGLLVNIDIESLRTGEDFSEGLMKLIEEANIFQLFWSKNAAKSTYVEKEWRHALSCTTNNGVGFILPVFWELPAYPCPSELSHLHFTYLKISNKQQEESR